MAARKNIVQRANGRKTDELRPVTIVKDFAPAALASVLMGMGNTRVICSVSVEDTIPPWMRAQNVEGGWLSAEYALLPCSTQPRAKRESSTGKLSGRTQEIQRLVGRSLRAVTDLKSLGKRTIWLDCDVLQADGGTRTASITGAWLALRLAVNRLLQQGALERDPIISGLAAVSVGLINGTPLLDLDYSEDSATGTDMNVIMTSTGKYVEVQGCAEKAPFSPAQLQRLLRLAQKGIGELIHRQNQFLKA